MSYRRPASLSEALELLHREPHQVIAGATDVFPAHASRQAWGGPVLHRRAGEPFLDVTGIPELGRIHIADEGVEIGAGVTWTDIVDADLPAWFECLKLAGREVGGVQIQNRGTLAGNLCNASPAADGVPALLALDARVRLQSKDRIRELTLDEFIVGNRATTLAPDELLTAIRVPRPEGDSRTAFLKLGARRYLVISIAMTAIRLDVVNGHVAKARVAVGACGPVARRLHELEARLRGRPTGELSAACSDDDVEALAPIDDVRASATYRRHAARVLVNRALANLGNRFEGAAQ